MKENTLSVVPGHVLSLILKISRKITHFWQYFTSLRILLQ